MLDILSWVLVGLPSAAVLLLLFTGVLYLCRVIWVRGYNKGYHTGRNDAYQRQFKAASGALEKHLEE